MMKDGQALNPTKTVKILLVGDRKVGKTSLCLTFDSSNHLKEGSSFSVDQNNNPFNIGQKPVETASQKTKVCVHANLDPMRPNLTADIHEVTPTSMVDVYHYGICIDNVTPAALKFIDMSGNKLEKKISKMRQDCYRIHSDIDVVLMCFSMVDPISFANVSKKWFVEIRQFYKDVPILLVGTKFDIKSQMKRLLKRQQKGQNLMNRPLDIPSDSPNKTGSNTTLNKISSDSFAINLRRLVRLERIQSEKQGKCEYCTEMEVKKRTAMLNNARSQTLNQSATLTPSLGRRFSRRVSIVSVMSQEHIVDANMIYLRGTHDNLDKAGQDFCVEDGRQTPPLESDPVYIAKCSKPTGAAGDDAADERGDLGYISLGFRPPLYRTENLKLKKEVIDGPKRVHQLEIKTASNVSSRSSADKGSIREQETFDESQLEFLNVQKDEEKEETELEKDDEQLEDLDGLLQSMEVAMATVRIADEPDAGLGKDMGQVQSKVTRKKVHDSTCTCVNMCEPCQAAFASKLLKEMESVSGRAGTQSATVMEVVNLNESFNGGVDTTANESFNTANTEIDVALPGGQVEELEKRLTVVLDGDELVEESEEVGRLVDEKEKREDKAEKEDLKANASHELDLRSICESELIKRKNCEKLKNEIGAKKFMRCSSLDLDSVKDVVDAAVTLAVSYHTVRVKRDDKLKREQQQLLDEEQRYASDASLDLNESSFVQPKDKNKGLFWNVLKKKVQSTSSNATQVSYVESTRGILSREVTEPTKVVMDEFEDLTDELKMGTSEPGVELDIEVEKSTVDKDGPAKMIEIEEKKKRGRFGGRRTRSLSRCLGCARRSETMTSLDRI